MRVSCSLCGGENTVHPGQKMLFCAYCGSALAVHEKRGPEHLILPHRRNDAHAALALRSHLLAAGCASPRDIRVEFSYVPYAFGLDEDKAAAGIPCRGAPRGACPLPSPPAGDYRFFDPRLAGGEEIVALEEAAAQYENAARILHLPLYRLAYRAAGKRLRALVMGESLHVYAESLPPRREASAGAANLLAALALTAVFFLVGRLAHSAASRAVVIAAAAAAAWLAWMLRQRMVSGNE